MNYLATAIPILSTVVGATTFGMATAYTAFQMHWLPSPLARTAAKMFFYPTLPITIVNRYMKGNYWDVIYHVDDTGVCVVDDDVAIATATATATANDVDTSSSDKLQEASTATATAAADKKTSSTTDDEDGDAQKKVVNDNDDVDVDDVVKIGGQVILGAAPLSTLAHPRQLYDVGVRGVINLCDEYDGPSDDYRVLGITQLRLRTVDHFEPSTQHLHDAVRFIERHVRQRGDSVYIHCKAGHGRSAAIAAAWLIHAHNWTPTQAQTHLNRHRHVRKRLYLQPNILEFAASVSSTSSSSPSTEDVAAIATTTHQNNNNNNNDKRE